jgi:DNA-binding NarL/FixJ family response regulator
MDKDYRIKIAIVDDDTMTANLLRELFDRSDVIDTLYTAHSGNELLDRLENDSMQPDIVLLDLRMKDGDGFEVLEKLSKKDKIVKVIVMSNYYNLSLVEPMLNLGCDAFLPKEVEIKELLEVIEKVHSYGHYFLEEQIANLQKLVVKKKQKLHPESKDDLSNREIEVLKLLAQQLTTKEIGEKLFVTKKTIEVLKSNLLLKIGTKNTAGLIIYAIQNKLIDSIEVFK